MYKLQLLKGLRVHPKFNITLLEKTLNSIKLLTKQVLNELKYDVEKIRAYKQIKKGYEFLVKWENYPEKENT